MRKMVLRRLIIEAGRPRGGTFHEPVKVSRVQRARGGIAPIPFTNRIFAEVGIVFPLVSLSCTTSRESSFIPFSLSAKRRFLDEDKNLERISFYRVYIYIYVYLGGWFALKGAAFAAFLFTFRGTTIEFRVISVGHRFTCHCLLKGMERCNRLRDEIYFPPLLFLL